MFCLIAGSLIGGWGWPLSLLVPRIVLVVAWEEVVPKPRVLASPEGGGILRDE